MKCLGLAVLLVLAIVDIEGRLLSPSAAKPKYELKVFLQCMAKKMKISQGVVRTCETLNSQPDLTKLWKFRKCFKEYTGVKVDVAKLFVSLVKCNGQALSIVKGDPHICEAAGSNCLTISTTCEYKLTECNDRYRVTLRDEQSSAHRTTIHAVTVRINGHGMVTADTLGNIITKEGGKTVDHSRADVDDKLVNATHIHSDNGENRLIMLFPHEKNLAIMFNIGSNLAVHTLAVTHALDCGGAQQGVLENTLPSDPHMRKGCGINPKIFDISNHETHNALAESCCLSHERNLDNDIKK